MGVNGDQVALGIDVEFDQSGNPVAEHGPDDLGADDAVHRF